MRLDSTRAFASVRISAPLATAATNIVIVATSASLMLGPSGAFGPLSAQTFIALSSAGLPVQSGFFNIVFAVGMANLISLSGSTTRRLVPSGAFLFGSDSFLFVASPATHPWVRLGGIDFFGLIAASAACPFLARLIIQIVVGLSAPWNILFLFGFGLATLSSLYSRG